MIGLNESYQKLPSKSFRKCAPDFDVCIGRLLALPIIIVVSPLSRLLAFFHGQVFGAGNQKNNSLSCAYIGQPVLSLVSSIVPTHLKGKKNAY
jgi:hypothetical protein